MTKPAVVFCLAMALLLAACSQREASTFCDDRAGLLSVGQRQRLDDFHRKLLTDADIHLLLIVLDKMAPDLDREAVTIFEQQRLGSDTQGARGVLLLVDPQGRQVRMEIGYDLEETFPDGFVAMIEHEQMIPFFTAGRVADGIEASVELLVAKALAAGNTAAAAAASKERLSGGAGARVAVTIDGNAKPGQTTGNPEAFSAGASPEEAFASYLRVLDSRNKDPELTLYTPDTRAMLRKWLVTDAQQAHERRNLSAAAGRGEWFTSGSMAVLRFPLDERQLPPYFFRQAGQGWMLDLAALSQQVGFNHLNHWHFRNLDHPYMFAFQDTTFDAQGFPHATARD